MLSNLPPGLSVHDIPGNRGMDEFSCNVFEGLAIDFVELDAKTQDRVWRLLDDYYAERYSVSATVRRVHEWLGVRED